MVGAAQAPCKLAAGGPEVMLENAMHAVMNGFRLAQRH